MSKKIFSFQTLFSTKINLKNLINNLINKLNSNEVPIDYSTYENKQKYRIKFYIL